MRCDILNEGARLAASYELLQRFRRLVTRRSVCDLIEWLADATGSGLRPFASLADGIIRTTPRSSTAWNCRGPQDQRKGTLTSKRCDDHVESPGIDPYTLTAGASDTRAARLARGAGCRRGDRLDPL